MSCETLTAPPVPVPAGPADTPAPTSSAAPPPAPSLTAWGLGVLLVAYAPVNFTFGSVNVLADAIGRDLRADAAGQQLVLAAYTTAFAATLVIAGRLGDRWGRRRLLLLGGLGVAVISIATAFAPGLTSAVALRVLLGIAAGLLTPQVLATIQSTSSGTARTRGLMLFVAVSGASTVVGQIVAGAVAHALPEHLGWRAVQILTGLIALTAVAGLRTVPRTRSTAPLSLDAIGASVLGASLLLIVVPLTLGRSLGWPSWTFISLLVGVALLAAFWVLQRRAEQRGTVPVVPPSVLRLTTVRRGLLMTLLFFTTYGAFLYELSAFAQLRYTLGTLGPALLVLGFGIAFIAASLA
ncbi:MAG: MFS transporter, partial [Brachybacterium tyrofermentans]